MDLKIGFLLPRSEMFPTLSKDFLNGFKLGTGETISASFYIESIGNATGDSIIQKAEKLILQDEVDLTISFCSHSKLKELAGIFNAYKTPLIVADLGANVLKEEHVNPFVVYHSLYLWQSFYAAGVYAAKTFGKKAAITVSFYDGGYQLAESFIKGFTDFGGNVTFAYVSPFDYKSESFENMIKGIQQSNSDVLFSLFSFKEGDKVMNAMDLAKINNTIPIVASPLLTSELHENPFQNLNQVYSIASWSFDDSIQEMIQFKSDYSEAFQALPTIFSLLGYEIGLLTKTTIHENKNLPANIGEFAQTTEITTPRGKINYLLYNESQVQENKIRHLIYRNNQYQNQVKEKIKLGDWNTQYQHFKDLPETGWQNPYIIT